MQTAEDEGVLQRIIAVLGFRGMAIAAAVIVVVVVGVGFAFGNSGNGGAPDEQNAIEVSNQEGQEGQQNQEAQDDPRAVNPDEPADLVWRDESFAVDPSFTGWKNNDNGRKVVYLTVDDGPSKLTQSFLDLFDKYNVKATFFVTGHDPDYYHLIREAYNKGHTIGLHTMTHDYALVYASESAYYEDLDAVGQVVKDQIGYVPCFIRFPGGSSNGMADGYSKGLMIKLAKGVVERGYQYYDWSLSTGDGDVRTAEQLIEQSTQPNGAGAGADPTKDTNVVLLCHDSATKESTLEALPKIIESYQKRGYSFEALDRDSWVCHHAIPGDTEGVSRVGSAADSGTATGSDTAAGDDAVMDENTTSTGEGAATDANVTSTGEDAQAA